MIGAYSIISMLAAQGSDKLLKVIRSHLALLVIFVLMLAVSALISMSSWLPQMMTYIIPLIMGVVLGFIRPATLRLLSHQPQAHAPNLAVVAADQLAARISAIVILPVYFLIEMMGTGAGMLLLAIIGILLSVCGFIFTLRLSFSHIKK